MFARWKLVLFVLALPLILGAQTSRADSDQDHHHYHHRRYYGHKRFKRRHHRAHCARSVANQPLERLPVPEEPSFPYSLFGMSNPQTTYSMPPVGSGHACTNTLPILAQYAPGRQMCFAKLFHKENAACSIHTMISPAQGNNPSWGIGLCTIELSPAQRLSRGYACSNISSVEGQVACCVHLYDSTHGRYFGPILRGETERCG